MGVAFAIFACTAACAIRPDELECEEAVGRLTQCCDLAVVDGYCTYVAPVSQGCSETPAVYPALTPDESRCIRAMSCAAMQSSGVCARAAAVQASTDCSEDGCSSRSPVCP